MRIFLEKLLIFCLPFLVYGLITWLFPPTESQVELKKRKPIILLSSIGLFLVILSLLYTMMQAKRSSGVYRPPHLENGQLIPGYFE
jgi:hypothetical protein